MWTVNDVIMWQNEKKREYGPIPKNKKNVKSSSIKARKP